MKYKFLKENSSIKRNLILLSILLCNIFSVSAQDPQFSQLFSDRLYLNPALAGTLECGELNFNFHNPYPEFGKAYKTISASFDSYVETIGGGIGIEFLKDSQGNGALNTLILSMIYSYKIKINAKINLNLGIQAGMIQKTINPQKLIFSSMIDPNLGTISGTSTDFYSDSKKKEPDFSTGLALYSKKIFAGLALFHLNSITKTQQNMVSPKIVIYFGEKINFNKFENENNLLILAPFIAYKQQAFEKQLYYGFFVEKRMIRLSEMLTQNLILNSLSSVSTLEIKYHKFRFSYSYEIKLTKYYTNPSHSNEISVSYEILCRKKNIKGNTIFCQHF